MHLTLHSRTVRHYISTWLLAVVVLCSTTTSIVSAQPPANSGWRNYGLQGASAGDVQARLQKLLGSSGFQFEVQSNPRTNELFVRGDDAVHKIAAQMIRTMDRPAVQPPNRQPAQPARVAEGYAVPAEQIGPIVEWVRKNFPHAQAAADQRTSQVMVIATPQDQQRVAKALSALQPPVAAPRPLQPPVAPQPQLPAAFDQQPQAFKTVTAAQFEALLRSKIGPQLRMSRDRGNQTTVVSTPTAQGEMPVMRINQRSNDVQFNSNAPTVAKWKQLAAALDTPDPGQNSDLKVVHIQNADPDTVQHTIALLQEARKRGTVTTAIPIGRGHAQQAAFLNNIFQQGADGNAGAGNDNPAPNDNAQAGNDNAAGAGDQPADEDDDVGGLLGPVEIVYIEGLGLVIKGHKRDVARLQAIIDDIERISQETEPEVEIYPMKYADNKAVAQLVRGLYDNVYGARQSAVSITGLGKPNAILLIGARESVDTILKLIAKLDTEVDPNSQLQVFNLLHMSAVDAATLVQNFYGATIPQQTVTGGQPAQQTTPAVGDLLPRVVAIADFRSNSLIVQASPRDMQEISLFIEKLDVESAAATSELRVFRLANALATDLEAVILGALAGQSTGANQANQPGVQGNQAAGGGANSQATAPSGNLTFQGDDGSSTESGILAGVTVVAEPNVNALVVRAPAKSMPLIAQLIEQLDRLPEAQAQIKVFPIENADAIQITGLLQQLFGQPVTAGVSAQGQAVNTALRNTNALTTGAGESSLIPLSFATDVRTNSVIVTGAAGDLETVEVLVFRLDEGGIETRKTVVHRLKNAPASDVATAIQNFLNTQQQITAFQNQLGQVSFADQIAQQVIVVPELVTNSLIVSAAPEYYEAILQIINDLDFRPKMVMVQAVIAEVRLDDQFEFGVELGLQDSLMFNRGVVGGAGNPGFNFNTTNALPNLNTASQSNLAGQALSNLGLGRQSGTLGYGGLVLSAASDSVNMLIRALQDEGRLQVLSRPQIKTLDGEFAFVQVGQTVSRVAGTTNNVNGVTSNVVETDIGLLLRITPRINQDGVVIMEVDIENSSLSPTGVPIATDAAGNPIISPNINITTAQTTLTAQDGQTVVFAGLITKNRSVASRKVPYLADVPVLGHLFRTDTEIENRSELLIFLTPHIIDNNEDVDMIKYVESDRMSWCLADILEIHGDAGLSGGRGLWGPSTGPVIYPDVDPTGAIGMPYEDSYYDDSIPSAPAAMPVGQPIQDGPQNLRQPEPVDGQPAPNSQQTPPPLPQPPVREAVPVNMNRVPTDSQSRALLPNLRFNSPVAFQPNPRQRTGYQNRPAGYAGSDQNVSRIPAYAPSTNQPIQPVDGQVPTQYQPARTQRLPSP